MFHFESLASSHRLPLFSASCRFWRSASLHPTGSCRELWHSRSLSGDAPDPATSHAPWRLYNVGNSRPVEVIELVQLIEHAVGRPAIREFLPMQPGDVLGDLRR
jgi:hypothetical protein